MNLQFNLNLRLLALYVLFFAVLSATASADSRDRTQFGRDIVVGPAEQASEVTCFGCSIHIRGHVEGDATAFGGGIIVEDQGTVGGDSTSFGGNVRLEKGAQVHSVTVFGGRLHRDPSATVAGDVTDFGGSFWLLLVFGLPLLLLAGFIALIVWLVRRLLRPGVPVAA